LAKASSAGHELIQVLHALIEGRRTKGVLQAGIADKVHLGDVVVGSLIGGAWCDWIRGGGSRRSWRQEPWLSW